MAISKQCTSCTSLNPITISVCRKCHAALRKDRYKVRVKKKTIDGKIKWTLKTVSGVRYKSYWMHCTITIVPFSL